MSASTFLGGNVHDFGYAIAVDTSGYVYVTGSTESTNFPTTSGAYDTAYNGGINAFYGGDVFVSKLDGGLANLQTSTFLGSSGDEQAYALTLDTSGNICVMGYTYLSNFPVTSGAYDTSRGGYLDVFISKLDGNLSANDECVAESITATPYLLTIRKNRSGDVTITVTGKDVCQAEGVTVTATINGNGKRLIAVSPGSQETDANGQVVFSITAKDRKGTAVIKFKARGLNKVATAQVKVR